jgi:flagellar hook-associated protein 1 FlgK
MANFSSKILNNAAGALAAQQAIIANLGNNIANVNTPGFSRRIVNLETNYGRGTAETGISIGNGVRIGSVARQTDQFIEKLLRDALGSRGSTDVQNEFLGRIENLFSLSGNQQTIGSTLSAFFTSLNDLSANPSSIELRNNTLQRAGDLVNTIQQTFSSLASLQREADNRLATEIQTVNSITAQIAQINGQIKNIEQGNSEVEASDERDQRDTLLGQLAEKISFTTIESSDGTVQISLANGISLVTGETSKSLDFTNSPSFAAGNLPPALDGGVLSHVVYDYDPSSTGQAHVDLTQILKNGTGSVAGLLALRGYNADTNTTAFQGDGILVETASRVEALTRSLLTNFNQTYLGPDRDGATAGHQPSSGDLDGNNPAVFGFFDFNFSGAKDRGVTPDGLPTTGDLDDIVANTTTRNFSSILSIRPTNARQIAAARDTSSGPPAAASYAPGDNSNLLALIDLKNTPQSLSAGNFSLTATYDQAYNESVTYIGNRKSAADVAASVAGDNVVATQARRDSVSAVNLDEEFTRLISFQKAYQASAKMIKVADDLLTQVLQLL